MNPLIGLASDVPGSGRRAIAKALCEIHGYKRIGFLDSARAMVHSFLVEYGYSPQEATLLVESDHPGVTMLTRVKGFPSIKQLIRTMECEWGRNCVSSEVWAHQWIWKAERALISGNRVVCDDLWLPEQVNKIRQLGGDVWAIESMADWEDSVCGDDLTIFDNEIKFSPENKPDRMLFITDTGEKMRKQIEGLLILAGKSSHCHV